MLRSACLALFLGTRLLFADGPPISITSPDTARTFASSTIKNHALIWSAKDNMLLAEVTFVDSSQNTGQVSEDSHVFRLPGITLDEKRGLFLAATSGGDLVPVARRNKQLFFTTIQVMPNAVVRILHQRGQVSVTLEATNQAAPAAASSNSPDDTHPIDLHQLVQ